ncbi:MULTISPECIES: GntR family transcriptional regulator [Microbacterium]|uniref:GntR family transcriptional regulator n=1 Tax=Microbacterium TaxID=33882 RepID=UPI000B807CE5|nr:MULTISPECIES: GntR family transcriptional regulator [Microbacterium]MBT2496430.1 GntR family transcriptional regulator [Microbacterium sp. ISL-59]NJI57901.1 GntR family transcriptional regulator [Microbacterium sp. B19(2022)]PRA78945.1 GntR family transcriptional regulator [Microbacterium sp. MYb66]
MSPNPKLSPADEANPALDIYRQLRGLIVSGQLGAGERLPTVRQTASDLGVAPGTAARAYKMLEGEGLVISRTAAGTRVAETAGVLPASVIRRIRELVEEAASVDADPDDVVDVLRTIWQTRTPDPSVADEGA